MAENTGIEWTNATWNPVAGCSVLSPGCKNCYAMKMAARLEAMGVPLYAGLTQPSKAGPVWNGVMRLAGEKQLSQPMRWKKPRRIFVNSMSDLFHEKVLDEWIDRVFAEMDVCQRHIFQILTKRSDRMRLHMIDFTDDVLKDSKPLPNVWLGVSVENRAALHRIDDLRVTPAAKRFLSLEPLLENLGEIDLTGIDWVIAGGESGKNARPMHPDWVRNIRDQCAAAGVPFFFKQWGAWVPQLGAIDLYEFGEISRRRWVAWDEDEGRWQFWDRPMWCDDLGAPEDCMVLVGKKTTGSVLDGIEHKAFPA